MLKTLPATIAVDGVRTLHNPKTRTTIGEIAQYLFFSFMFSYLLSFLKPLLIGSSRPSVCIKCAPVKYIKITFHQRRLTTRTVGSQLFKTPIVQQVESSTILTSGDSHSGNMKMLDNTAKNCLSSSPSQPQTMPNRNRTARKMFTGRKAV